MIKRHQPGTVGHIGRSISDSIYGWDHELIGKPCLWLGRPAMVYGSHQIEVYIVVCVVFLMEDGLLRYDESVHPDSDDLLALDPDSYHAKQVCHNLLSAMVKQIPKKAGF